MKQNGVPGLLEIYRSTAVIGKKQSWRKQVFQIKNENLMYFKSSKVNIYYFSNGDCMYVQ